MLRLLACVYTGVHMVFHTNVVGDCDNNKHTHIRYAAGVLLSDGSVHTAAQQKALEYVGYLCMSFVSRCGTFVTPKPRRLYSRTLLR
jgi:hypothetical protein